MVPSSVSMAASSFEHQGLLEGQVYAQDFRITFPPVMDGTRRRAGVGRCHGIRSRRPNRELYVKYVKARPGQPTLVVLNGLTWAVGDWDPFVAALAQSGYGLLRYDAFGQGETLLKYAPITDVIPAEAQVSDLALLLDRLAIEGKVDLLGLSYGGGLGIMFAAAHPDRTRTLTLMAPFTQAVNSQDNSVRMQIAYLSATQPWNRATDDELYDYYLHVLVYDTYPYAEPSLLDHPYKLEATYQMVRGIRKFVASTMVATLPPASVHLVIAERDQFIPRDVLESFYAAVPPSARGSVMVLNGSEHKIPENFPHFAAAWTDLIAHVDARLSAGRRFVGEPARGEARAADVLIPMPEE